MRDINAINAAIDEYFQKNKVEKCKPKDLMPIFIKKGIFATDNRQGQPFRKVLRALDKNNQLGQIPSVEVDRKVKNCYWWIKNLK